LDDTTTHGKHDDNLEAILNTVAWYARIIKNRGVIASAAKQSSLRHPSGLLRRCAPRK